LPEGDCKPPQFILASEKFLVWREKFRKKFLLGLPGFPPGIMAPESEGIFIQKSRKHFLYLCEGFPKEYLQEKQKQREKKPCEKDKGVEEGFAKGQDFLPHRREGNIDFRPSQEIPVVKKAVVDGVDFSRKGGAEFEKIRYGKKISRIGAADAVEDGALGSVQNDSRNAGIVHVSVEKFSYLRDVLVPHMIFQHRPQVLNVSGDSGTHGIMQRILELSFQEKPQRKCGYSEKKCADECYGNEKAFRSHEISPCLIVSAFLRGNGNLQKHSKRANGRAGRGTFPKAPFSVYLHLGE